MKHLLLFAFLSLGLALPASAAPTAPSLSVSGDIAAPLELDADKLAKFPRVKVTAGKAEYEGFLIGELIKLSGLAASDKVHGNNHDFYLLAEGSDGYRAVFSVSELDPAFMKQTVLVADKKNGQPLPAGEGPLRLIVPGDARASRAVRQLKKLTMHRAP